MLVYRGTKCTTAEGSLAHRRGHSFTVWALMIVSWLKVLEVVMSREDSEFRVARVLAVGTPSMLETNQTLGPLEE